MQKLPKHVSRLGRRKAGGRGGARTEESTFSTFYAALSAPPQAGGRAGKEGGREARKRFLIKVNALQSSRNVKLTSKVSPPSLARSSPLPPFPSPSALSLPSLDSARLYLVSYLRSRLFPTCFEPPECMRAQTRWMRKMERKAESFHNVRL